MKRIAIGLALLMLLTSLAAPLPAWCLSGFCAPTVDESAIRGLDCCDGNPAGNQTRDDEDCPDCVSIDSPDLTIPKNPFDPGPAAVAALDQQPPTLPLTLFVAVEGSPVFPTGPPIASAILRDLRTVRILI